MTAQPQAAKSAAPPMDASDVLRAALARHQAGDLEAAARLYGQVLEAFPDNPDALHLLGVLTHQQGDNPTAAEMIGRSAHVPHAHVQNFLDAIRTGKEPNCGFELGYRVAVACRMAVESYLQGRTVRWDREREEII